MRRSLLLGTALTVLAGSAFAADLGTTMPYTAPPVAPVPLFSWTGCYIGGNIGGGFGHTDITGQGRIPSASVGTDTSGFIGGGQVGCNYQFTPNWVVGAEGMFDFGDIKGSQDSGVRGELSTINSQTDWLTSATGRLGYSWDRWMLYAKGGAAWAHDNYVTFNAGDIETRFGWTVGAGVEWAFWNGWSARLEYNYYDFGTETFSFADSVTGRLAPFDVNNTINTVTIGVNYRFGAY